jgi:hypothetical protein
MTPPRLAPPAGFADQRTRERKEAAPSKDFAACQFCPAYERVPATHTYDDPQGYRYRLCDRHHRPIGEWRERKPLPPVPPQEPQKGKR